MATKIEKPLLLSLIKDDLLNYKLVSGLTKLGLNASPYCLNLSESIFYLSDIAKHPDAEQISERYFKSCRKIELIDVNDEEMLEILVEELAEILGVEG